MRSLKNSNGRMVNVHNISKIHNEELLNTKYLYLMYHLSKITIATVEQLKKVIDLESSQIVMVLANIEKKGYLRSTNIMMYKGSLVRYYMLNEKGTMFIRSLIDEIDIPYTSFNYRNQIEHTIEIGEIYFELFNDIENIKIAREKNIQLGERTVLRPDAKIELTYSGIEESFYLEHDRGTESKVMLETKFNNSYSIFLLSQQKSKNIIMTISRTNIISKQTIKDITKKEEIVKLNYEIKVLTSIRKLMKKICIESIEVLDLEYKMLLGKTNEMLTFQTIFLADQKESYEQFKLINTKYKAQSINDILDKVKELKKIKSKITSNYLIKIKSKYDRYRTEVIKELISSFKDEVIIDDDLKESILKLKSPSVVIKDKLVKGPSFKQHLLTNEMIISSSEEVSKYFSNRIIEMEKFKNMMPDSKYCEVEFYVNDIRITKSMNSWYNAQTDTMMIILEPYINFSDEIKFDLLKVHTNIKHNYNKLLISVKSIDGDIIDTMSY